MWGGNQRTVEAVETMAAKIRKLQWLLGTIQSTWTLQKGNRAEVWGTIWVDIQEKKKKKKKKHPTKTQTLQFFIYNNHTYTNIYYIFLIVLNRLHNLNLNHNGSNILSF